MVENFIYLPSYTVLMTPVLSDEKNKNDKITDLFLEMNKNNIFITCHHCMYSWISKTKKDTVTCSICKYKVNVKKCGVKIE